VGTLFIFLLAASGAALLWRAFQGAIGGQAEEKPTQGGTSGGTTWGEKPTPAVTPPGPGTSGGTTWGTPKEGKPASGKEGRVTSVENITARFASTGSPAWAGQKDGKHWGTDFAAPPGSPVFAPYAGTVNAVGAYTQPGLLGQWVQLRLADGLFLYLGHLQNRSVSVGDQVVAGQKIGETNVYAHTHVQLAPHQGPCAVDGTCLDFEAYRKAHP
jgi:murein DD-endopeptidase MepM/ murein hydrolase activator NlpD